MCAPETSCKPRRGFILLLTLLMLGALSSIAAAFTISLSADMRSLAIQTNDAKAFWLAEAGIADATKRLKNSEITLEDGDKISLDSVSFGDGSYSVTLSMAGDDITVRSEGTVRDQTRALEVVLTRATSFPPAFRYAIFGNNSNGATLEIGNNKPATVQISGDVFYDSTPDVDTVLVRDNSSVIDGLVYADKVTGGGKYEKAVEDPNPIPMYPKFNTSVYDETIAMADASIQSNLTLDGAHELRLNGRTLYCRNVTIRDNATVAGPGTIVATQSITIRDGAVIGSGVNVIGKSSITVRDSAAIDADGLLFSRSDITLRDDAHVTSSLLAPSSKSTITVENDAVFTGMIYGDIVNLKNNAIVNGSVVASRYAGNSILDNVHINFGSSYLPAMPPNGMVSSLTFRQKADSWNDVS